TTVFQHSRPALLALEPIQGLYGGSCFSQNGLSIFPVVVHVVLVTTPFYRSSMVGALFFDSLDSRLLTRLRRPVRAFNTELLGVLRVQSLPAAELYRIGANEASDRGAAEKAIQNVETNVPPGSAHGDEAVTDVGPQRKARAANNGFEFPSHIEASPLVLKRLRSVGSHHRCFGNKRCRRSHRGQPHRGSNRTQVPIRVEGRPLAQMRRVGKRLPDFLRRVAQFTDENERPLLSVFLYSRSAGRARRVLLEIGHLILLSVDSVPAGLAE